jgi:hypothetical protein
VAYKLPLVANIVLSRVALLSKLPTVHSSSSLTCDSLTTCSWCLKLCTGFESSWVSNISIDARDGAQAGIRGVTPSSRNAPMNPNSLGIAIEGDETGAQEVCSLFVRKRCRKPTCYLEDNDHRDGDSVQIGPAAKPILKSKLKQVRSEVVSVKWRWPSVLIAAWEQILLV